jgi:tetratricopeptide (TPR) repeat protein
LLESLADNLSEAHSLQNKAALLFEQGNLKDAIPFMEKSLGIYEKELGSENPHLGQIRDSIASMYESTGEYDKALATYEKEYLICSKNLGKNHSDTLVTLSNIARCAQYLEDYPRAIELLESLVSISKSAGKEDTVTAIRMSNLANIYRQLGDLNKAIPLLIKSLKIEEKENGASHPDTIMSINNLAYTYTLIGDADNALILYKRILKIYETTDVEDPYKCLYLGNIAIAISESGDHIRALEIAQNALNNSDTIMTSSLNLLQIGTIYDSIGEYDKALINMKRALKNL